LIHQAQNKSQVVQEEVKNVVHVQQVTEQQHVVRSQQVHMAGSMRGNATEEVARRQFGAQMSEPIASIDTRHEQQNHHQEGNINISFVQQTVVRQLW
jgi:soluble cytochrome b562